MTFPQPALRLRSWGRSSAVCASLVAGSCAGVGAARAQRAASDALYRQFGGQPGRVTLTGDFSVRVRADAHMGPWFQALDQKHVKQVLLVHFCAVSGAPCKRDGPNMAQAHAHAGIDVTDTEFNALIEVLQLSTDAQDMAFRAQNRMPSKRAPTHRETVNVPPCHCDPVA